MHRPGTLRLAVVVVLSFQLLAQGKEAGVKHPTLYRTVQVDGLSIFYREAGPKDAPVLLLLHGLPSSSRMFESLFARLSDSYHLVAPDYPGFGHSDWPDPKTFAYTFDHLLRSSLISLKHWVFRATRFTCRTMAARLVFAWRLRIRNASKRSSFKMPSLTMKVWVRTGMRAGVLERSRRQREQAPNKLALASHQRTRHVGNDPNVERYDPDLVDR